MDRKRLGAMTSSGPGGPEDGEIDWLGGKGQSRLLRNKTAVLSLRSGCGPGRE